MAPKRLRNPLDELLTDASGGQRRRTTPAFFDVVREVTMLNSFQKFAAVLEPMIRSAVREEVGKVLACGFKSLHRWPSGTQIEDEVVSLKLEFVAPLNTPIFTGGKIEDVNKNNLKLRLVDAAGWRVRSLPSGTVKIEIVALDGDFAANDKEEWTKEDFDRSILKERVGRRPLLGGDVSLTMRDGELSLGELTITDNSSWLRCRQFRIGARVAAGSCPGVRIREAFTGPFRVKDHRGELYKKNYPPALGDEVWRLEKIGKDGTFHERLSENGINTVQDFLKLCNVNSQLLRMILGQGMSDKMWDGTTAHARTCAIGDRFYIYRRANGDAVALNPICEPIGWFIDGLFMESYHQKSVTEPFVLEAFSQWGSLEDYEGGSVKNALIRYVSVLQGEREGVLSGHQDGSLFQNYEADFEFYPQGMVFGESFEVNNSDGWVAKTERWDFQHSDDEGSSLSHSFLRG